MTEADDSRSKKAKVTAPDDRAVSELQGRIGEGANQLQTAVEQGIEELKSKDETIRTEVKAANTAYDEMQKLVKAAVDTLVKTNSAARAAVDVSYERMELVADITTITALIAYTTIYLITFGFVATSAIVPSLLLVGAFYGGMRYALWDLRKKNSDAKYLLDEPVREAKQGAGSLAGKKLRIEAGLGETSKRINSAWDSTKRVVSWVREYVPAVDEYYSTRERMNRQSDFTLTLRNALIQYGLDPRGDANLLLQDFRSISDDESNWLSELAAGLSHVFAVPPAFITLAYADFTGNRQVATNAWLAISQDRGAVSELVKLFIRTQLVETEYIDQNLSSYGAIEDLVIHEDHFSLELFRSSYYKFYVDLVKEKRSLLDALKGFGMKAGVSTEDSIKGFVPSTVEEENRRAELLRFCAARLGIPFSVVAFVYSEREADVSRRMQAWREIRDDENTFRAFVRLLLTNGIIVAPSHYTGDMLELTTYCSKVLGPCEDLTLQTVREISDAGFNSLEVKKKYFIRGLEHYNVGLGEEVRESFESWLLANPDDRSIAGWLSSKVRISEHILLLFVADYLQAELQRKEALESIQAAHMSKDLADILLSHDVIRAPSRLLGEESSSDNLRLLIDTEKDFDTSGLQALYYAYDHLLEYMKGFVEFMSRHGLSAGVPVDFKRILEALKTVPEEGIFNRLLALVEDLLIRDSKAPFSDERWLKPISLTVAVLYFDSKQDSLRIEACKAAGANEASSRMLYQYILQREQDEQKATRQGTPLSDVVLKTIDDRNVSYDYLVLFTRELTIGYLYPKISLLMAARLTAMDEQIRRLGQRKEELEKTLMEIGAAVREFLEVELTNDTVMRLLSMQLVAAYMITSSSLEAIFTQVLDVYLPLAAQHLSASDPAYARFLLWAERTTGGKSTRMGLVPYGMSFEDFSRRFAALFQEAVRLRLSESGASSDGSASYSANVLRIFPSDVFFKRVEGSILSERAVTESNPISILRNLILEEYGPVENLELVASLQRNEEKSLALGSVMKDLINQKSSLLLMTKAKLTPYITNTVLERDMESKDFDRRLLAAVGYGKLTDLAEHVYRTYSSVPDDIKEARKALLDQTVLNVIRNTNSRLGPDVNAIVCDSIFAALYHIGMILEGLASETSLPGLQGEK